MDNIPNLAKREYCLVRILLKRLFLCILKLGYFVVRILRVFLVCILGRKYFLNYSLGHTYWNFLLIFVLLEETKMQCWAVQ